jgi:hypothetical protein
MASWPAFRKLSVGEKRELSYRLYSLPTDSTYVSTSILDKDKSVPDWRLSSDLARILYAKSRIRIGESLINGVE